LDEHQTLNITQHMTQGSGNITFLGKKMENSHELVVPANALWYIGFCDTDRLWTSKTREKESTLKKADKGSGSITRSMRFFITRGVIKIKRQFERSPE